MQALTGGEGAGGGAENKAERKTSGTREHTGGWRHTTAPLTVGTPTERQSDRGNTQQREGGEPVAGYQRQTVREGRDRGAPAKTVATVVGRSAQEVCGRTLSGTGAGGGRRWKEGGGDWAGEHGGVEGHLHRRSGSTPPPLPDS